jgi:hypothetical protein
MDNQHQGSTPNPEPKAEPLKLESWQTPVPLLSSTKTPPPHRKSVGMSTVQKLKIWGVIAGIIAVFIIGGQLWQGVSDPRNSPSETHANGKATCERLIEEKRGTARSDRSDVFEPSIHTYKLQTWVQRSPRNELWLCRLIWNGKSWDVDTLTQS